MNPEESKQAAKAGLGTWLTACGINISKNFSCLNPEHEDHNPSMSFDQRRNRCHCFSCGADYDIFDVAQIQTGLSGKDLFDHVYRFLGIHVEYNSRSSSIEKTSEKVIFNVEKNAGKTESLESFFALCHAAVGKTDYWARRGLSRTLVDAFNLGFWEEKIVL